MIANKGAAIAASVAALFVAEGCSGSSKPVESAETNKQALVKCEGINECKGTSECKSADGKSGCQGLNECKGQGWITVPAEECTQKGGKVLGGSENADGGASSASAGAGATSTDGGGAAPQAFKCAGINSCAGTSECAAADGSNACRGHNSCAGKGWITVPTEGDCSSKGGTLVT